MNRLFVLSFVALTISACSYDTTNDSICGAGIGSDALGTADCECSEKNVNFCDTLSGSGIKNGTWTCNTSGAINRCEAKCDNGYHVSSDKKACEKDGGGGGGNGENDVVMCGGSECKKTPHAVAMTCESEKCVVEKCESGYKPSESILSRDQCIAEGGNGGDEVLKCGGEPCRLAENAVSMACEDDTCAVAECEPGFHRKATEQSKCVADGGNDDLICDGNVCSLAPNASLMMCSVGDGHCTVRQCKPGFEKSEDDPEVCISTTDVSCNNISCPLAENAKSMKCDGVNQWCMVKECNPGYHRSEFDISSCVPDGGDENVCAGKPCPMADNATEMACLELSFAFGSFTKRCVVYHCDEGYEPFNSEDFQQSACLPKCNTGYVADINGTCNCSEYDMSDLCPDFDMTMVSSYDKDSLKNCNGCVATSCKTGADLENGKCVCHNFNYMNEECTEQQKVVEWFLDTMDNIVNGIGNGLGQDGEENYNEDNCNEFAFQFSSYKDSYSGSFDDLKNGQISYVDCSILPDDAQTMCWQKSMFYGEDKLNQILNRVSQNCGMVLHCDSPYFCADPPCGDPRKEDSCKFLNEFTRIVRNVCRYYKDTSSSTTVCDQIGYQSFLEEYN